MAPNGDLIETTTRPWWVRALLLTGLAGAAVLNGGALPDAPRPVALGPSR